MVKVSKNKCCMCGKKLIKNIIKDGENNFCDIGCRDWFKSTYESDEEVKPIE